MTGADFFLVPAPSPPPTEFCPFCEVVFTGLDEEATVRRAVRHLNARHPGWDYATGSGVRAEYRKFHPGGEP